MSRSDVLPSIPLSAGIGLRAPHYRDLLERLPDIGWLEIHPENYFGGGGQPLQILERLRQHYPLSFHGVGLSIGSTDPPDEDHLSRLVGLAQRFEPGLVSDHLSWGSVSGRHLNDLLPLPYTEESLKQVCERVAYVQERLGRPILLENISSYLLYEHSSIPEGDFLAEVSRRTGCGILLDVNNLYVNAENHGIDTAAFLEAILAAAVMEIHLAGFDDAGDCLIDTHGRPVAEPVWNLFARVIGDLGARPVLIEWDTDIPPLDRLLAQARRAGSVLENSNALAA